MSERVEYSVMTSRPGIVDDNMTFAVLGLTLRMGITAM